MYNKFDVQNTSFVWICWQTYYTTKEVCTLFFIQKVVKWCNIRKAKELGYFIEMHYVGLDTVETAKERVKYRVQQGGHGIPEEDIEKRYIETFEQLNIIYKDCDLIAFYDNTESFRRFAICKKGEMVRISSNVPEWFSKVSFYNR